MCHLLFAEVVLAAFGEVLEPPVGVTSELIGVDITVTTVRCVKYTVVTPPPPTAVLVAAVMVSPPTTVVTASLAVYPNNGYPWSPQYS